MKQILRKTWLMSVAGDGVGADAGGRLHTRTTTGPTPIIRIATTGLTARGGGGAIGGGGGGNTGPLLQVRSGYLRPVSGRVKSMGPVEGLPDIVLRRLFEGHGCRFGLMRSASRTLPRLTPRSSPPTFSLIPSARKRSRTRPRAPTMRSAMPRLVTSS